MPGFTSAACIVLRRLTGYRLYHLLAVAFVLVSVLGALAIAFWWLGQRAEGVAGVAAVAVVALAYLYAAMAVLVVATAIVFGLTVRRVRNLFARGRLRFPQLVAMLATGEGVKNQKASTQQVDSVLLLHGSA